MIIMLRKAAGKLNMSFSCKFKKLRQLFFYCLRIINQPKKRVVCYVVIDVH